MAIKKKTAGKSRLTTHPAKKKTAGKSPLSRKSATTKNKPRNPNARVADAKIFEGLNFGLTGTFNYGASQSATERFIRHLGGKITKKTDSSLDILLLGNGVKKTQREKDAQKLNKKGAGINIIHVNDFFAAGMDDQYLEMLLDPAQIALLHSSLARYWVHRGIGSSVFTDRKFSKAQFGKESKNAFRIVNLMFKDCYFRNCQFTDIDFSVTYTGTTNENCKFQKCRFDNCTLHPETVEMHNCNGSKLDIGASSNLSISKSRFDELELSGKDISLTDCQFNILRTDLWSSFKNSMFTNVAVKDLQTHRTLKFENSILNEVVFSKPKGHKKNIRFYNSKLTNVTFRNFHCKELLMQDCELLNCRFENCKIPTFDLRRSKIIDCSAKDLECSFSVIDPKSQGGFAGIDFSNSRIDLALYPATRELAQTLNSSRQLAFSFEGKSERGTIVIYVNEEHGAYLSHTLKTNRKEQSKKNLRYQSPVDDVQLGLLWVFRTSGITDFDIKTLVTRKSGCKMRPKELKELIFASVHEAITIHPRASNV